MYVCILNNLGEIVLHQNIPTDPAKFLKLIAPFREDLVIGVECIFSWYWLADLCEQQGLAFILGHALYMKAIHGGNLTWAIATEKPYCRETLISVFLCQHIPKALCLE